VTSTADNVATAFGGGPRSFVAISIITIFIYKLLWFFASCVSDLVHRSPFESIAPADHKLVGLHHSAAEPACSPLRSAVVVARRLYRRAEAQEQVLSKV